MAKTNNQPGLFDNLVDPTSIDVPTTSGKTKVQVERVGDFLAVHPTVGTQDKERYTVTHAPTGYALVQDLPYKYAMKLANELVRQATAGHLSLAFTDPTVTPNEALRDICVPYLSLRLPAE